MTMKKKILTTLSVVLILGLAALGILAYLSDTDSDVNVMTLGNVQIDQIEQERGDNGDLQDFTQAKPAFPAVGPIEWATEGVAVNGTEYKVFTDELKNVVDKIITVKNTGKSDAYVRTLVAIEAPDYDVKNLIHVNVNTAGVSNTAWAPVDIDGVEYVYSVFTYEDALKPNEISTPSLMQVFLDAKTTNEDVAKFGETWEIKVLSQAVQKEGFDSAANALETAFPYGDDKAAKVAEWFEGLVAPVVVDSFEEMVEVCKTGGKMVLAKDITYTAEDTVEMIDGSIFLINGKNVTVDLNGHNITVEKDATDIYGAIFFAGNPGGHINIVGDGNITVKNGLATVVWVLQGGTANIYDGTYTSNSVSHEAMFYSQGNGGVINVYGGKYIYDLDRHLNGGFNVSDQAGANLRIILHEGVLLSRPEYSQHLQGTTNGEQNRIQLAAGCEIQEVVIDGTTWYQVVKK